MEELTIVDLIERGDGLESLKSEALGGIYYFDTVIFDKWIEDVVSYFSGVEGSVAILEDINENRKNQYTNYRLYKKVMEYLKLEKKTM